MSNPFKVGDKVIVIGRKSGHSVPINTQGVINIITPNGANQGAGPVDTIYISGQSAWFHIEDLKFQIETVESLMSEVDELDVKISELLDKKEKISKKIRWMEEVEVDNFDENHFKVYEALKVLKNKDDIFEASLAISKLINN